MDAIVPFPRIAGAGGTIQFALNSTVPARHDENMRIETLSRGAAAAARARVPEEHP